MAIKKPRMCIVTNNMGSSHTQGIEKTVAKIGVYEKILYTDNTKFNQTYLTTNFDIMFLALSTSILDSTSKQVIINSFNLGVNVVELTVTGTQTAIDASAAIYLGSCSTASIVTITSPDSITLNDDKYKIAKKSGLKTDGTVYNFSAIVNAQNGCNYQARHSSVEVLYTKATNTFGILMAKGSQSYTITETKAHFVALGNMYNSANPLTYTADFDVYLESIVNMMMGIYIIKGTVKDSSGAPLIRDIFVYLRSDGSFVKKITSLANGSFEATLPVNEDVFVVAKANDNETLPTVVYDKIKPVINLY